jgi:hypothetical protein
MIELISNAVMANAVHTLEAVGYVTLAIAVFEHYTGVGPKMLPGKWSAVPALVLTIGLLALFAVDQGLTPWWLVASVAIINGSLAGFGSNVAHIGAQVAGGGARRARAKEVVGELGAVQIGRDATDKDDVKSTTLHVTVPSKANYPTQVGSQIKLLACSLLLVLVGGCAGSFEEARLAGLQAHSPTKAVAVAPSERCQSLDNQHRTWGGVAKVSAVMAGAQGLSAIPVEDKRARIGLAAGTAVTAAAAAGAEYLSEGAAESWARECSH